MLGAGFLDHGDGNGKGCEAKQDQRLGEIAEQQIGHPTSEQQRQHRLAQDLDRDAHG